MPVDYHVHAVAHGEYEYSVNWLTSYVEQAKKRGLIDIGFSEHDEYIEKIDINIIKEVKRNNPDIGIKLGLEVDYRPEADESIKLLSKYYDFDYLIGSVHFIGDWAFDHPDYKDRFDEYDIDVVYQNYYDLVDRAVKSGLFDIVGHIDLVKIWGHKPKQNVLKYVEPVLCSVKETGMAVEINGAGLRKPVKEIYPEFDIIQLMKQMNIPITLGSDAHHPDQMGMNIDVGVLLAKKAGYKNVIGFKGREKIILPFE